jgi:hypothetical protein
MIYVFNSKTKLESYIENKMYDYINVYFLMIEQEKLLIKTSKVFKDC